MKPDAPATNAQVPAPDQFVAGVEDAPAASQAAEPGRDAIARLAYSYWEARGCEGGSPEEDWSRAEEMLRAPARDGGKAEEAWVLPPHCGEPAQARLVR